MKQDETQLQTWIDKANQVWNECGDDILDANAFMILNETMTRKHVQEVVSDLLGQQSQEWREMEDEDRQHILDEAFTHEFYGR